jgi:hypothetical protein
VLGIVPSGMFIPFHALTKGRALFPCLSLVRFLTAKRCAATTQKNQKTSH